MKFLFQYMCFIILIIICLITGSCAKSFVDHEDLQYSKLKQEDIGDSITVILKDSTELNGILNGFAQQGVEIKINKTVKRVAFDKVETVHLKRKRFKIRKKHVVVFLITVPIIILLGIAMSGWAEGIRGAGI